MIKDFFEAAFPWIVMGLSLAWFFVSINDCSEKEINPKDDTNLMMAWVLLVMGSAFYNLSRTVSFGFIAAGTVNMILSTQKRKKINEKV